MMMKHGLNLKGFLGGGLLLLIAGCYVGQLSIRTLLQARSQHSWEPVPATVSLSQRIETRTQERQETTYRFAYTYSWNGSDYTGTRYSLGQAADGRHYGVARYQRGEKIIVFINTLAPDEAVVERVSPGVFVYLCLPLALLALVGSALMSIRRAPDLLMGIMHRGLKDRKAWGARYATLDDVPEAALVDEAIASMPKVYHKRIRECVRAGKAASYVSVLQRYSGVSPRMAEAIVNRFISNESA